MMPRPRLQEELAFHPAVFNVAYHPPILKKVVSPAEKLLQAVLVAVVGTGLGIGVGVFLAGRTLPADASAVANPTPPAGTSVTPSVAETQPQSATSPVPADKQNSGATVNRVAEAAVPNQGHEPRILRASLTVFRGRPHHRRGLRHLAAVSAISLRKPIPQPPVEEAKLELPDGRFRFTIEGDQTAVAYDAQSGVVSTDGSGLFVVDKAPGETSTVRPQETPSNLHYKCDQDSNCSLVMASVVVPHARMRTTGPTMDWAFIPVSTDGQSRDGSQMPVNLVHVSR
jgi:hypothetical protein